ncbi:adhesion G-protein coupled receptor G4 isoform X2 [Syngnathoides biaculeatus]|uniref:adhesion G-protein coupled receptor G4 isoform X2 n=1 Tax=Syngnathoides biaculeatus TaxID=300417 RepID=UPI002ADE54EF|nr:adhesion G-protein coupled receptor G4 isoform X2 [Syngnathoides biaculeatus]
MLYHSKIVNMVVGLTLLSSAASSIRQAPLPSLWGNVAQFTVGCRHWRLEPHVFIPALDHLTVCLHINFKVGIQSKWTAFMYHHPEVRCATLGLGGQEDALVVWLFGTEWTTPPLGLAPREWHSLCLTWSHIKDRPVLYINGTLTELQAAEDSISPPPVFPSCCKLAPNGTLTLGAAHHPVDGIKPTGDFMGSLSLFRLWGRQRSSQEVSMRQCTEGDVVHWSREQWDTHVCAPIPDDTLTCEWSIYTVSLKFNIVRYDGNNTELYTARDIAHRWLRAVLPSVIYLHRVSVFEATRSSADDDNVTKTSSGDKLMQWASFNIKWFGGLVYLNVIPAEDVAVVQHKIHAKLGPPYRYPGGRVQVLADEASIQTTPVDSFPSYPTTPPPAATSMLTSSPTQTSPNVSELYYEVRVIAVITGECDAYHLLATWLNDTLSEHMMVMPGLQLLPKDVGRKNTLTSVSPSTDGVSAKMVSSEKLVFQVLVMTSLEHSQETETLIRDLLLMPYSQGSASIATQDVQISRILVVRCQGESQLTRKGLFKWPVTPGGKMATRPCPGNTQKYATRHCKLSHSSRWMAPNLQYCPLVVETFCDLDFVEVTPENALDVLEMMESLLSNRSKLNYQELVTVVDKLKDVVGVRVVTAALGQALIDTISDVLESHSYLLPFTNIILNITEAVGDFMVGFQGSFSMAAPGVAVSMVDVVRGQFAGLTFGVSSRGIGSKPEIFLNNVPLEGTAALVVLPPVLQHSFPENQSPPRVQFQFYGIPELFNNKQKNLILNSLVVSASVCNITSPIQDLREDVRVTLRHLRPKHPHMDTHCAYWNFNENNGHGGWDPRGCNKHNSTINFTTCLCDHLTHFGVLLDVSRAPVDEAHERVLTLITYVGCGVSSLFLGLTVLTYTAFGKLRIDYPSQILIHLSVALLGLNLAFLLNSWLSSWGVEGLCVAAAATVHYFLLASFTWMGLEGVNMYFALVKVFNVYVPAYILKFCVLGWGIPLGICVLVLIVNRDAYGDHFHTDTRSSLEPLDNTDNFCWLQDDVMFYVTVVAYALLVFLFNIAVFVVVVIQIRHTRANSPAGTRRGLMHYLKGVATLTLLLGLTWTAGFFTWGPARVVLFYVFSLLNSLQGVFIFLFHCLMKENVRRQWRVHLCFGKFRLEDHHSEWSHSVSASGLAKQKPPSPLNAGVSSVRSVESDSTESTSASSESGRRGSSWERPDLGIFVKSLFSPRAHTSNRGTQTIPPHRDGGPHTRRQALSPVGVIDTGQRN